MAALNGTREFVLAGCRSQEYVKLKLTPKQLKRVATKLAVAPLTDTLKTQTSSSQLTERRNKSTGKQRATPVRKRSLSKLATAIKHFGPRKNATSVLRWQFQDESETTQKTPKFKYKKELVITDRTLTPSSQQETELATAPSVDLPQKSKLHTDIEDLDKCILQEIEFHDSANAVPTKAPSPLLLPADLLTSYTLALQDIQRMRSELENLKCREAGIVALNSRLKDTISLQQRRNEALKSSRVNC